MDENCDPNSSEGRTRREKKKPVGRPRKLQRIQDSESVLEVAVEAVASHLTEHTNLANPLLSLRIPNRLLLQWRTEIQSSSGRLRYIACLNKSVPGGAVLLRSESERLERVLQARASTVHSQVAKAKGSRSRELRLNSSSVVVVDKCDVVAATLFEKETSILKEKVAEANVKVEDALKSVDEIHEEFATQCVTYLDTIEKQTEELKEIKQDFTNKGRTFDDVGGRQKRRKLNDFSDAAKNALWFAESFGFKVQSLQIESKSGSVMTLPLCTELSQPQEDQQGTEDTRATLYLLDKFAVSDEFYHELSMSHKALPRSYKVKGLRTEMSKAVKVHRLEGSFYGAYRPFEDLLTLCLSREVCFNSQMHDYALEFEFQLNAKCICV